MGSLGNPKPWVPYMINTKDCSQGFCSLYCPQWCYVMFPPPPPIEFPDDHKDSTFSPLVIAVIGIFASAFLLVTYYAIISKYCKKRDSSNGREVQNPIEESQENQDSLPDDSLQGSNNGLDEALIKSITMFKFKKQEGLTEATDCSVCLSEFEENESLRLLPKCNHAFHKMCIDTWLKSHSNCPLCRSNIVFVSPLPPQLSPVVENPSPEESSSRSPDHVIDNVAAEEEDIEMGVQETEFCYTIHEQAPSRHPRNSDNSDVYNNIRVIKNNEGERMRRSISMDHVSHYQLSVADVLRIDQEEEEDQRVGQCPYWDGAETSKRAVMAMCKSSCGNDVLHCVAGGAIVKRSLSCGRFLLSNSGGKGRNVSLPL